MPSRSSAISSDSASTPSKLMLVVFGTRRRAAPLTAVPGTRARTPRSSRSRSAPTRAASAARPARARRGRNAEADDAGHVLGAGAPARSCLPPVTRLASARAAAHPQRAGALGARRTCAPENDSRSTPSALHVHGNLASRLHRVGVERARRARARRRELGDRLDRACLVVRVHDRDEGRPRRPSASRSASGVTMPARVRGHDVTAPAAPGERPGRVEHGLVLDRRSPGCGAASRPRWPRPRRACARLSVSVPPPVNTTSAGSAPMSAATCRPRLVQLAPWRAGRSVDARRVAERAGERATNRLDDREGTGRGGVVVEIDRGTHG